MEQQDYKMAKKYAIKLYSLDGDYIYITEDTNHCMDLRVQLFDTKEDCQKFYQKENLNLRNCSLKTLWDENQTQMPCLKGIIFCRHFLE